MNQAIIDLYDKFTHGRMSRRAFMERLVVLAGSVAAAEAVLPLLGNDYARAETIPSSDPRLRAEQVTYEAEGRKVSGYLARPVDQGKRPAVIVIHENRGLNPHIEDVTRRMALEGFLAFGPDLLSSAGGTPKDEDKARELIGQLKQPDVSVELNGAVAWLASHAESTGKVGVIGFCWGGAQVNQLAASSPDLDAGVAYYGRQIPADRVAAIKAPLMLHYAGIDENVNAGIDAYKKALEGAGKTFELHMYEGANHAFNNDTNPGRYNKAAAELSWERTSAFLKKHLGESQKA